MSDKPRRGVLAAVLIAGVLSLLVTLLRLYGELNFYPAQGEPPAWVPMLFPRENGKGLGIIGIAWLVPVFGFWFGRRLAAGGRRPAHAGKALLWCLLGVPLTMGVMWVTLTQLDKSELQAPALLVGMVLVSLTAFRGWRAAWAVNLGYAVLARVPVIVVQYMAIQNGWVTHYSKGPQPDMTPQQLEFALTLAQVTFWPFGYTAVIGSLFAVIGSQTVKQAKK